uniref:nicotinate-nucleotide adenylyltransferase n=1 Tax=Acetatifactor sp. TaxID=1872090 RepID=UPI004057B1AD
MKKIGLMGGTFNPIHVGHLILAQRALEELKLDEIWLIPTGCSYMKKHMEILPGEERFKMATLAIADEAQMKCLDIEIKRSGYTYSYETLEQLRQEYPDNEFYFIFGADCLFSIENWKCPERIFSNCKIIAAVRNGASSEEMNLKIKELKEKFQAEIILLPFPNLEISSTVLRERIRTGKSVKYFIPDSVIDYISENHFYTERFSKCERMI